MTPCSCHTVLELGHHQIHRQSWIISARAYTQEMANNWTRETIEPGRVSNNADPLIKQNAQMRRLECWMRNRRRCSRLSIHHQRQQIQHWRLHRRVFPRRFPIATKNSICSDYLTEKFYRALEMSLEISPLVYEGAHYSRDLPLLLAQFLHPGRRFPVASSHGRLPAPPGAQPSPLRQIPGHWTKDWEIDQRKRLNGWCRLCEKLNAPTGPSNPVKVYPNMAQWYYDKVPCLSGATIMQQYP